MPKEIVITITSVGEDTTISPINEDTLKYIPTEFFEAFSDDFRRYLDRYRENNVFGDYQCG